MKLLTEMQWTVYGTCCPDPFGTSEDVLIHDSAAAHALMQAMEEFVDERDAEYTADPMDRLMERADSILAEWGFDSGEVDGER